MNAVLQVCTHASCCDAIGMLRVTASAVIHSLQALASVQPVPEWLKAVQGGRLTAALLHTLQCEPASNKMCMIIV